MKIIIMLFMWLPPLAWAQSPVEVNPACRLDSSDLNDIGYSFSPESTFHGKCVDSARYRPLRGLKIEGDQASFSNYLHEGKHWLAHFPLNQIGRVYFHVIRFPVVEGVVAAHTEIRFLFEQPAKLFRGLEVAETKDLLLSFEAALPIGEKYNFAKGFAKSYALVGLAMSTQQKAFGSANTIEQYDLSLNPTEKRHLLEDILRHAQEREMKLFYNTARPNCTTEIFDQLDGLPRFNGQSPPFLTMISVDPIAGPALEDLRSRGLLKTCSLTFAEEQAGKTCDTLTIPRANKITDSIFPRIEGKPFSLVTVLPDLDKLSPAERAAIEKLREKMILAIPELIQSYGSALLLASEGERGKALFLNTLKEFANRLPEVLRSPEVNAALPVDGVDLRIYFLPHEASANSTQLSSLGIPARLPFALIDYVAKSPTEEKSALESVRSGFSLAGKTGVAGSKGFLMGGAILVRAQKDHSRVLTQVMAGLNQADVVMNQVNDLVSIQKLTVPEPRPGRAHPAIVISHDQDAQVEQVNQRVGIEFGPFVFLTPQGGLKATAVYNDCWHQMKSVPVFHGHLKDAFSWAEIKFYLFGLTMNLKTQVVEKMDVRTEFMSFYCISRDEVNVPFAESATASIKSSLENLTDDPNLGFLAPFLQ